MTPRQFLLLILSFIPLFLATRAGAEPPIIKIGVSLPLTGPASTYGNDLRNTFNFVLKHFGNKRISLIFEDDRCDPKEAVNVAQKFANVERVNFVTGLPCSGATLASAPIYEKAKVVTISAFAGSPKVTSAGDYIFRTRPSDVYAAKLLQEYVSKKHPNAAILVEQTEYAIGLATTFQNSNPTIAVQREEFTPGTDDLKPVLLRLKATGFPALILFTQTEQSLALAVRGIRELNWNVQIYGSLFPGNASFLKLVGTTADGIIFSTLPAASESNSATARELFRQFVEEYGPLNSFDAGFEYGYNAFAALEAAATAEDPKNFLYSHPIAGLTGTFKFDENGDLIGTPFVLRRIKGGKVSLLAENSNS